MSFPMQSRAVVVRGMLPVRVASCNGVKMISGSGRLGSWSLISLSAFWTDSPSCCLLAASFEAAIALKADTTNTIELMLVYRIRRLPFATHNFMGVRRQCLLLGIYHVTW